MASSTNGGGGGDAVRQFHSANKLRRQIAFNDDPDLPAINNMPDMDFDDILPHIREFGRYQTWMVLMLIPFQMCIAFVYFVQFFVTLVPPHWCRIDELQNLSQNAR